MHATTDPRVFPFGVFTHDDPVQVLRRTALQRGVDARQDAGRTHIGVLVQTLTDLQPQAPQGDVIRHIGIPCRTEQDGVLVAQRIQPIFRHHDAVLAIVVGAPVEILELEFEIRAGSGNRLQHLATRRNHFFADAVPGNGGDAISFHGLHSWI